MDVETLEDAEAVANRGADFIAAAAAEAVSIRGRFTVALSGGRTPWRMLQILSGKTLPWEHVHVFQVDERVVPADDPQRNLTQLSTILRKSPLPALQIYAMPVDDADLAAAADKYAATIGSLIGSPTVLDLVHLGLGPDGHTASLVPGDDALAVTDREVAIAGPYQGRLRMTLTYPLINRARRILWVVAGADKTTAVAQLCAGDTGIPAGRVNSENSVLLLDRMAAG